MQVTHTHTHTHTHTEVTGMVCLDVLSVGMQTTDWRSAIYIWLNSFTMV